MLKNYKKIQIKNCGVCGDIAIGRNFGAITCESCKAFFRRTAFKTNGLNCSTNGKCVINTQNRKTCKKCRLDKCLAIGMIRELILKNNEKICPKLSIKRSERFRANSISSNISSNDSNNSSSIDSSLFDRDFDSMFENCCLSDEEITKEIMEIESYINDLSTDDSKSIEEQKSSYMPLIPVVRPIATYNKQLNDIELNRLQELSSATNCLEYLFTPFTQNVIEFPTLKEYFTNGLALAKFDEGARQFVQFCKSLNSFEEICQNDQLALIKYGFQQSVFWQQLKLFNFDEESWSMYLNNGYSLRFSLKLLISEHSKEYNVMKSFIEKLSRDIISDTTLRNLLSAVVLFDPNRPKINHKELIKLKQQMYLYLLQRYLIQKYGSECKTTEICSKIFASIQELEVVAEIQKESEKVYIKYLTPLLREILTD